MKSIAVFLGYILLATCCSAAFLGNIPTFSSLHPRTAQPNFAQFRQYESPNTRTMAVPPTMRGAVQVRSNPPVFLEMSPAAPFLLRSRGVSRAAEPTPYIKYYIPTYKCEKYFFCRAELTAYAEFQGMLAIEVGYSVWSFTAPSVEIPPSITDRILNTSDGEIVDFMLPLGEAVGDLYPDRDALCDIPPSEATAAFEVVIAEMASCTHTTNFVCQKTKTLARC